MTILRGKEIIFTRVEPEYSPRRRSGYQTVYYSNGLSVTDVKAIEKRVQCFQTKNPSLVRRQFFTLDSGQVVLTHSMTIDSHPQIVDKNRRSGVFLAHGLIFKQSEFDKAENNPFKIFDAFTFVDDAETMVHQFNQAEGREPECRIELDRDSLSYGAESWSEEAAKLVALAEQAAALKVKSQSILFYGSEDDIDEALRAVFCFVPKRTRLACSFDTHIERCMTPRGLYWAVGTPSRQQGSYIYINATSHQVGKFEAALDMSDMYIAWLQHVAGRSSHEVMMQSLTIQELNEAFRGRHHLNQTTLDEEACESFLELHEKQIIQDLRLALANATSPTIGDLLAEHMWKVSDKKVLLDIAASQSPMGKSLSFIIESWLIELNPEFAGLKRNDWKELQKLANYASNHTLLFWASVLGNDKKHQEEALIKMDSNEFNKALHLMLNPIAPAEFVAPQHLTPLLSEVRLRVASIQDEQFVELVRAVVAAGGSSQLDGRFAHRISNLGNKALIGLEKELLKSYHVSKGFVQAVHRRREELGTPTRVRDLLSALPNKLFRRKQEGYREIPDYSVDNSSSYKKGRINMMSWLPWVLGKQIICPYCLTEIRYRNEIEKCANDKCGMELPIQYIDNYEQAPPFFVQIIGWSQVGKTTYLQALTLMLMKMGKFWRANYSNSPLTEVSRGYVRNVREFLATGKLPDATHRALQEAYMMLLLNMPRWGGRTLVTRDVAGEVFNDFQFSLEYTPYLLHVPTTFLMISLYDLQESKEHIAMDELMISYIETMANNDRHFRQKRRKVIVVLSKADKIFHRLPDNLQEYLNSDPLQMALDSDQPVQPLDAVGMQDYMDKLARVSLAIQNWISSLEGEAQNLIALAKNNNIDLEFTIVSSTGSDVGDGKQLPTTLLPTRVLDPYFWALDFQSR